MEDDQRGILLRLLCIIFAGKVSAMHVLMVCSLFGIGMWLALGVCCVYACISGGDYVLIVGIGVEFRMGDIWRLV